MNYKKIKTLEQAYAAHPDKIDLAKVKKALKFLPVRYSRGMIARLNASVLTFVLNNDNPKVPEWIADYNNTDQKKFGAWTWGGDRSGAGFRFDGLGWTRSTSSAHGGARLALKDLPRLQHAKKYFPEIYKEDYLILE